LHNGVRRFVLDKNGAGIWKLPSIQFSRPQVFNGFASQGLLAAHRHPGDASMDDLAAAIHARVSTFDDDHLYRFSYQTVGRVYELMTAGWKNG